jgi:hypothetical protein
MAWLRRAWWWLAGAAALMSAITVAMASSLSITSANLTSYRTCVVQGYPSTTTADSDSMVQQDVSGSNFGTQPTMDVQSRSTNKNRRSYVKFDLTKCTPNIASTASVKVATLRLATSALASSCRTDDVYRVTGTWTETGITWANQPATAGTATSSVNVGTAPCANSITSAYVNWDVTSDVAAFVAATGTNFGWMVRDRTENSSGVNVNTYLTKEAGLLGTTPQLVVNYS